MDDENKAILIDLEGNDMETVLMASSRVRPRRFLYDEDGVQVYPYN